MGEPAAVSRSIVPLTQRIVVEDVVFALSVALPPRARALVQLTPKPVTELRMEVP